jgi:hypothetical protein
MVQVDPIQSYLNLEIGLPPGTKSGVFRYLKEVLARYFWVKNSLLKTESKCHFKNGNFEFYSQNSQRFLC